MNFIELATSASRISRIAYKEGLEAGVIPDVVQHLGCNVSVRGAIGDKAFESLSKIISAKI